jgi:hypothetical protein
VPKKHYDLLSPETLEWFKAGTRVLSLTRTWLITEVNPEADTFRARYEDYWGGEEVQFWTYELFWFTPIKTRFQREAVS